MVYKIFTESLRGKTEQQDSNFAEFINVSSFN